jgi:hypothetical protein
MRGDAEGNPNGIKGIKRGEMMNSDDEQGSHGHARPVTHGSAEHEESRGGVITTPTGELLNKHTRLPWKLPLPSPAQFT